MAKPYSQINIVKFLFKLWRASPVFSWLMVGSQIAYVISTTILAPIFISQLLTNIADGSATLSSSAWLLVGYAAIQLFGDVIAFQLSVASSYIAESQMQSNVAARILERLSANSLKYHAKKMSGGIVANASKLNNAIENFWYTLAFIIVPIVTTIISVCVALSFIMWQYAIALTLLAIVIIFVSIKTQTSIAPISRKVAERSSDMMAHFSDIINNIAAVKAFSKEKYELGQYKKLAASWRRTTYREMRSDLIITSTSGFVMAMMNVLAFIAAILATQYHLTSIGTIYLVISYTLELVNQLWTVSDALREYLFVVSEASPMVKMLDEDIDIKDPYEPAKLRVTKGKIEFKHISFAHEKRGKLLFDDFSLTINPGEKIGIIGNSGSGKSTLARLLLRFNDINSGKILIDNQNIKNVRQSDLRSAISYVPQDPTLLHRTVRENIAYGDMDATNEQIIEAARQSNALGFIEKLPKGFNTIVGEGGYKLSSTQRQRIAVARAILKNAPILILDEATSSIDNESEKLIQDSLKQLMQGRTSIIIAHRLSTIAALDRIIVMNDGKIVESGTHSELLASDQGYAKSWNHQSGGFIKE